MIQITFSFPDAAAAAAMLAQLNGQQLNAATVSAPTGVPPAPKPAKSPKAAPAAATAPSSPTAEAAPPAAAPAQNTEPQAPPPATAAPAAAASAPSPVTYPDLQKAVLTLHKLDPTAAVPIAKSLGADTFKLLKPEQWAEAHRLVTEAIAARG